MKKAKRLPQKAVKKDRTEENLRGKLRKVTKELEIYKRENQALRKRLGRLSYQRYQVKELEETAEALEEIVEVFEEMADTISDNMCEKCEITPLETISTWSPKGELFFTWCKSCKIKIRVDKS